MSNTMRNTKTNTVTQAQAIGERDRLLRAAAEVLGDAHDRRRDEDIEAIHAAICTWLDNREARFPGVAARLRAGLEAAGWSWDVAMAAQERQAAYYAAVLGR